MGRHGVGALIVLGLSTLVACTDDKPTSKKDEPEKAAPITAEKLIGEWKDKTGEIKVEFTAKKDGKISIAVLVLKSGGSVTVGSVGYEIDDKKNEVTFSFATNAVAKPTKDGALMFAGEFTFGTNTYKVPETRIERVKAGDAKK